MATIKIKKFHKEAKIPKFATTGSTGADLIAAKVIKNGFFRVWYSCEFAAEIPKGYAGLLFPRANISEMPLTLSNSVGIIDPDYRGNFEVRFNRTFWGIFSRKQYKLRERIAQLVIMKTVPTEYEEVKIIKSTRRGSKGYGSTGK